MNAILSIKPKYVEEIKAGRKRFEFRKAVFKRPVEKVYIYASAPVSKVVGEFQPVDVLIDTPDKIWAKTRDYAGITEKFYKEYFAGKQTAYAIVIQNFVKYDKPFPLPEGVKAPQSFCYIDHI